MTWYGLDDQPTVWVNIVEDYFSKKMLKTMGFTFDGSDLSDFQIQAYQLIMLEAAKLEKIDNATMNLKG